VLGRVNEALFLELLNCVALLMFLEKAMKDLCCISITTNMRFQRLQAGCETAIQEMHVYIIGSSGWIVNLTTNHYLMCR
jgi:hypothetical protein